MPRSVCSLGLAVSGLASKMATIPAQRAASASSVSGMSFATARPSSCTVCRSGRVPDASSPVFAGAAGADGVTAAGADGAAAAGTVGVAVAGAAGVTGAGVAVAAGSGAGWFSGPSYLRMSSRVSTALPDVMASMRVPNGFPGEVSGLLSYLRISSRVSTALPDVMTSMRVPNTDGVFSLAGVVVPCVLSSA